HGGPRPRPGAAGTAGRGTEARVPESGAAVAPGHRGGRRGPPPLGGERRRWRRAIAADGAAFAGWVASGVDAALERTAENLATLALRLGEPALAVVPHRTCMSAPLTLEACAARLARHRLSI